MGCTQSFQIEVPEVNPGIKRNGKKNQVIPRKSVDLSDNISENIKIISDQLTPEQLSFAVQKLIQHQLFGSLNKRELKAICGEMSYAKTDSGKYVFKQGDIGNCFFIIYKGSVDVEIDGKFVRTLGKGLTFGELALLFRCTRTATIVCKTQNPQFLIMRPALYKRTIQKMKLQEYSNNVESIKKVPLFSCLTNKQKYALSNTIKIIRFNIGEVIFSAGDDAQAMYIISEGNVAIEIPGKNVISLKQGQIFGEASLQEGMKRIGTAKAASKVVCSMISKKDIQTTLGDSINSLIYYNIKKWALMRSKVFTALPAQNINRFILEFTLFFAKQGEILNPTTYHGFVVCLEGTINNKSEGGVFNQDGWINKNFSTEKLVKDNDGYCCFLSFKRAVELFKELDNNKAGKQLSIRDGPPKTKPNLCDFKYIRKLGQGQFGQVFLVKNTQYGNNLYAIKCLDKQDINKQQILESVIHQRRILQKAVFPYIVGFVGAYHDKNYIFLLMEYIRGRQMFEVIRQVKSMSLDMIRYYFACLMVAIEYLHNNSIVYRDLKPENSVVDSKGKVYLIDLGTAKELTADNYFKTFTIIGTPHYMAPEVFEGSGYSFQADLWSLGCLLYEFVCYELPFGETTSNDPYAVYSSIKKNTLLYPVFLKDEKVKKLIGLLLTKNPKQRANLNFNKIRSHDYFKGFNWEALNREEITIPYIPKAFIGKTTEDLNNTDLGRQEDKELLKYLYKSDRHFQIAQWNSNTI